MLLLFSMADRGRRRSLVLALRLLRLSRRMSAEQKLINSHFSLVLVGLGCFWLSCSGLKLRALQHVRGLYDFETFV